MNYNELSKTIYKNNVKVGWWDDKDSVDPLEKLQLVSTEIAEATEGERKDIMDDHLPHRKMGEVELADAMIRILDFGGAYEFEYNDICTGSIRQSIFDSYAKSVAGKHFSINSALVAFASSFLTSQDIKTIEDFYSVLINRIKQVSDDLGYDLESTINEKLAYNASRADHKRENRNKEGGKKF